MLSGKPSAVVYTFRARRSPESAEHSETRRTTSRSDIGLTLENIAMRLAAWGFDLNR